jgi:gas vesicle protein
MSTGKVLLGVLAGVAAGAVLGILFAPDKGAETRKKVSKKGQDYADDLKEKFDDFLSSITDNMDNAKDEASELAEKGKAKFNQAKSDLKNSVDHKFATSQEGKYSTNS